MVDLYKIQMLIENNRNNGVKFGNTENGPTAQWIEKAEIKLGMTLPSTYKWFLKQYGGGEIHGDEIFSIYGLEFETIFGGDIVFQYFAHQNTRTLAKDEIPLTQNNQGEVYFFKTTIKDPNGEYPVFVKRGSCINIYAENFIVFLEKRILKLH